MLATAYAARPERFPGGLFHPAPVEVVMARLDALAAEVDVARLPYTLKILLRLDTPHERDYLRHGGILQCALRKLLGR